MKTLLSAGSVQRSGLTAINLHYITENTVVSFLSDVLFQPSIARLCVVWKSHYLWHATALNPDGMLVFSSWPVQFVPTEWGKDFRWKNSSLFQSEDAHGCKKKKERVWKKIRRKSWSCWWVLRSVRAWAVTQTHSTHCVYLASELQVTHPFNCKMWHVPQEGLCALKWWLEYSLSSYNMQSLFVAVCSVTPTSQITVH